MADAQENPWEVLLQFDSVSLKKQSPTVSVSVTPKPVTVLDVKSVIQSKFSIPKCLQKISLDSGNTYLLDSQLINELYIRSQDVLTITYLARAEVGAIKQFDLKCLCPLLIKLGEFSMKNGSLHSYSSSNPNDQTVCSGFLKIAHSYLLPWSKDATVEANRQYLVQEEIIDNTLRLYCLLRSSPYNGRDHFLQDLEISCLTLLWNFAETREARLLVAQRGGFNLMMESLVCRPETFCEKLGVEHNKYDLFEHSVGCISNYCEIEDCQLPLARNKPALDCMLDYAIDTPSDPSVHINIFTKVLIANCLFRLSHNVSTHEHLAEKGTLDKILKFFFSIGLSFHHGTEILMGYALSFLFSRVLSFSMDKVPQTLVNEMVLALTKFVRATRKSGWYRITKALEKFQCNWITMAPFIDVFFTPLLCLCKREDNECGSAGFSEPESSLLTWKTSESYPGKTNPTTECVELIHPSSSRSVADKCLSFHVLALTVEMSRPSNRSLAISQGTLDYLICVPWILPDNYQNEVLSVLKLFQTTMEGFPIPRLQSIATARLAQTGDIHLNKSFKF